MITGNDVTKRNLDAIFTYHRPNEEQQCKYVKLRAKAKELATMIEDLCPSSMEKSVAMIKTEEAIMWANAAIAREKE